MCVGGIDVMFIGVALDFEEFTERTLPVAPHLQNKGHPAPPPPLQARCQVLGLALSNSQKLVTYSSLRAAHVVP